MYCLKTTNIQDLPDEILQFIGTFLKPDDIDSCYSVCYRWRSLFNINTIWKLQCIYDERYFKQFCYKSLNNEEDNFAVCTWRGYYECQKLLWENWSKGKYSIEETGITHKVSSLMQFVDKEGISWLLSSDHSGITFWNISQIPPLAQCQLRQNDQISLLYVEDRIITFRSSFIKVFQFSKPDYKVKLLYRFLMDQEDVLSDSKVISNDFYASYVRFIIIDNIYIGYYECVFDIKSTFFHIWDLTSAKKLSKQSIYQQSFVDYMIETTGEDITRGFSGGLLLFEGDSERFLVTIISDNHRVCQISVFSLREMKFINVVTRVKSRTAWCFMKGDIVPIYHDSHDDFSAISVFHVGGQLLIKLNFPFNFNPAFSGDFWFSKTTMILKINCDVRVINFNDWKNVTEKSFKTEQDKSILGYFEPKFLLISDSLNRRSNTLNASTVSITVWDVESGKKLWVLGEISKESLNSCRYLLEKAVYPGRIILHLQGNDHFSILNFENVS